MLKKIKYAELADDDRRGVVIIKKLTDIKFGKITLEGFTTEECDEILQVARTLSLDVPTGWNCKLSFFLVSVVYWKVSLLTTK